jgi:hypothetical protein
VTPGWRRGNALPLPPALGRSPAGRLDSPIASIAKARKAISTPKA